MRYINPKYTFIDLTDAYTCAIQTPPTYGLLTLLPKVPLCLFSISSTHPKTTVLNIFATIGFAYSRNSYKWSFIECNHFCLVSFTKYSL